jgi:hypothetical protein
VRIGHRDTADTENENFKDGAATVRAVFVFGSGKNEARKQRGKEVQRRRGEI